MSIQVTTFPKLTTTQRNALSGLATNTVILNTTTSQLELWDGAAWVPQTGSGGSGANTALSNLASTDVNAPIGTADNFGSFGNSNNLTLQTGNTDDGTPGDVILNPGTATDTTRGDIDCSNARLVNVASPNNDGSAAANANYVDASKISPYQYIRVGGGSAPSINPNANAGAGASAVMQIHARNLGGRFSLTTGAVPASGNQVRIDYASLTYSGASYVIITPAETNAAIAESTLGVYVSADTTGFTLAANLALTTATTYSWNYVVMGD